MAYAFRSAAESTTDGFDVQYLQHAALGTFHEDFEGTAITQFLEQQYNSGPNINLVGSTAPRIDSLQSAR